MNNNKRFLVMTCVMFLMTAMLSLTAFAGTSVNYNVASSGKGKEIKVRSVKYDKNNDDNKHEIEVKFRTKVRWSKNAKVSSVKDNRGKKYSAWLSDTDSNDCDIYIKSLKSGRTYTIVINGIKKSGAKSFGKLTFKVKIPDKSWEIKRKDGAYFYQNQRVRIFMDLRADNSFKSFNYDELGTIDIRLIRAKDNSIKKVEYLSKAEAKEILNDLDSACSDLAKENEDISRLSKEMVSKEVLNVINSCDAKRWYVIVENGYQYIYYNIVPHNYAWQPRANHGSVTIDIFDIGKTTGNYVLLKVPENLKLTIRYNSKKIIYKKVNI